MDGMVDFALKITEAFLLLIALAKETFAYMLPPEWAEVVELYWKGLIGFNSWLGYAMAAGYFAA